MSAFGLGRLDGDRQGAARRAQRLRQPSRPGQQRLGLLGHLALLEMVDQLRRVLALGLPHRLQDARLGDSAEIGVDRRRPARRRHVEVHGLRQHVGMRQRLRPPVVGLVHAVDAQPDAVREQRLLARDVQPGQRRPEVLGVLGHRRQPELVPVGQRPGHCGVVQARRLRVERDALHVELQAGVQAVAVEQAQGEGVQRGQERHLGLLADRMPQGQGAMRGQLGQQPVRQRLDAVFLLRLAVGCGMP